MEDHTLNKELTDKLLLADLTIFINSCDAYEDCWIPFFKLFDKYWPNCELPIILNTETKSFTYSKLNIICPVVERRLGKIEWGSRFIESLKIVNTKYLLLIIDDFFISSIINTKSIAQIIDIMKIESATCTYLRPRPNKLRRQSNYEIIEKLQPKQDDLFNLQVAIWDKKKIMPYLRKFENPWSLERFGSKRAYLINADIYSYSIDYHNKNGPIINYPSTGGIGRGQWVKTVVDEILIPNGIYINTETRGFWQGHEIKLTIVNRLKNKIKRFPKSLHSYVDLLKMYITNFDLS